MAKEVLAVPEEHLADVIRIIRAGLAVVGKVRPEVGKQLRKWCDEEAAYLKRLEEE